MTATETSSNVSTAPAREGGPRRAFRIALCPPDYDRFAAAMAGGPADATDIIQRYLARFLAERGRQLTFFAPRGVGRSVTTSDIDKPVPSQAGWTANPLFGLAEKTAWRLQRALGVPYLNEFSQLRVADEAFAAVSACDLAYERSYMYHDGVSRACKRAGTPHVLFVEADEILEFDFLGKSLRGLLRRRAEKAFRRNLESAACILCVSSQLQRRLTAHWGVPASKIKVFQNAVDVERFRPDPAARADVRRALGVGEAPLLVFVGAFYRWHDVPALLEAYRDTLRTNPEARLALVGDGAERAAMEEQARTLGVAERTIFTGRVPHEDVPRYLAAADIAVAPYPKMDGEMWLSPLKVYESMAVGAPVVASSIGQLSNLIADGKTGLLVPAGDTVAFAAAIRKLLAQPELRASISRGAREHILRHHTWERYLSELEAVFEAVVDRRPLSGI